MPWRLGFMVIAARNPVHSVLFLILAFFNAAGLFVLMGAEFLGMILVVVYVGAVAVLFLFVVMMLDVDFAELRAAFCNAADRRLVGAMLAELIAGRRLLADRAGRSAANRVAPPAGVGNTQAIGQVLYTQYLLFFQLAGPRPAGRDDRRDRADAAPQGGASARTSASRTPARKAGVVEIKSTGQSGRGTGGADMAVS